MGFHEISDKFLSNSCRQQPAWLSDSPRCYNDSCVIMDLSGKLAMDFCRKSEEIEALEQFPKSLKRFRIKLQQNYKVIYESV